MTEKAKRKWYLRYRLFVDPPLVFRLLFSDVTGGFPEHANQYSL